MLWLNGHKVEGHALKISAGLPLAAEDMSGQSSATPKAETGDKPKTLDVSLQIRFTDAGRLRALVALAEAKDKNGERTKYTVKTLNGTAEAMGMKQVVFEGNFAAKEADGLKLWEVAFQLAEYRSTSEKKEERNPTKGKKKVAAQTASGTATGATASTTATAASTPGKPVAARGAESLSGFERILQRVDNALK